MSKSAREKRRILLENYDLEVKNRIQSMEEQLIFLSNQLQSRCESLLLQLPPLILSKTMKEYNQMQSNKNELIETATIPKSKPNKAPLRPINPQPIQKRITRATKHKPTYPNPPKNLPSTPLIPSSDRRKITLQSQETNQDQENQENWADTTQLFGNCLTIPVDGGKTLIEFNVNDSPSLVKQLDDRTRGMVFDQMMILKHQIDNMIHNLK